MLSYFSLQVVRSLSLRKHRSFLSTPATSTSVEDNEEKPYSIRESSSEDDETSSATSSDEETSSATSSSTSSSDEDDDPVTNVSIKVGQLHEYRIFYQNMFFCL